MFPHSSINLSLIVIVLFFASLFIHGNANLIRNSFDIAENNDDNIEAVGNFLARIGIEKDSLDHEKSKELVRAMIPSYMMEWVNNGIMEEFSTPEDLNISARCYWDVDHWFRNVVLLSRGLEDIYEVDVWILHMLDAWGKIPEGILSGHVNSLGDWDECVGLRAKTNVSTFKGRYCTTYLIPSFGPDDDDDAPSSRLSVSPQEILAQIEKPAAAVMIPSLATCWPSTCNILEVKFIIDFLLKNRTFDKYFGAIPYDCSTDDIPELDAGNIAMISILTVLGIVSVIATIADVFFSGKQHGLGLKILLAFSLYTNAVKCVGTKSEQGNLGSLHGIRFFSTCWVLMGHTLYLMLFQPFMWNLVDVDRIYKKHWTYFAIYNGFYSVDTFFTMSGMLASFGMLRALQRAKGKMNVPMMYLHRYLRITPTYSLLIGLIAAIFPLLGNGPWWRLRADRSARHCVKYWWTNLLYINNLISYDRSSGEAMCQGESWYIANDMQFFIVCPLFAYLLWRWRNIGFGVIAAALIGSIVAPAVVTNYGKLPPTKIQWKTYGNPVADDLYEKPWYRISPYLVGILMGYVLYKMGGKKIKLPLWVVGGGWIACTLIAMSLVFGINSYYDPETDNHTVWSALYAGLSRPLWACCICWIIFACQNGYGGWINEFLSWKFFMPLGRLTFCVYISSVSIQELLHFQVRQSERFDMYSVVNKFFSHVVMCFIIGFILTITMESPFIQLEKLVFGGGAKPKPAEAKPALQAKTDDVQNDEKLK